MPSTKMEEQVCDFLFNYLKFQASQHIICALSCVFRSKIEPWFSNAFQATPEEVVSPSITKARILAGEMEAATEMTAKTDTIQGPDSLGKIL